MSQFRVMTALRPSVPDAVAPCSPSRKADGAAVAGSSCGERACQNAWL